MFKRAMIAMAILALTFGMASAVTVTVDDIIKLHQEGVSPEVIKTFIKSSGQKFDLSADDILRMKKAGVPEEIIQLMIETSTTPEQPPDQPPTRTEDGEIEPGFAYRARYHSVYSFEVYKKRLIIDEKVLQVGKRDPLKNTAKRGGTLFLTDNELVMFDMDGDERFRLEYKAITKIKIKERYKGNEARFHPLDALVLFIYFKKDGSEYFIKVYTLPRPDKKDPYYGDLFNIGKAIKKFGKGVNPRLEGDLKVD